MITLFQSKISERLRKYQPYKHIVKQIAGSQFPIEIEGPHGLFLALLISELQHATRETSLIVTPNEQEAEALYRDLALLEPGVSIFPWWGTIPYRGVSPQATTFGQRMTNLMRLYEGEKFLIVAPLRALVSPVPPREFLEEMTISIRTGKEFDPISLEKTLQRFGYLRVPKVGLPGEFALRGEVLDVYPPGEEEGIRVVFDFETVEDIRRFDPISQASTDSLEQIRLIPVREVLWTDERIEGLERRLDGKAGAEVLIDELRATRSCRHEELYFPLSFERAGRLTEYLTDASTLYLVDPERLSSGSEILAKEYADLYVSAKSERKNGDAMARSLLPKPDELLLPYDELVDSQKRKITFPSIKAPDEAERINVPCVGARSFFGNVAFLKEELTNLIENGYEVTIFSESESQGTRIEHLLREFPVEIIPMSVSAGFSLPGLKVMVIQENEIFGRRRRIPASVRKAKSKAIDTFVELAPGDFVVHVNYGIGKFLGIERITAAGTERDYIRLEYAGEEMIFIPIEQVNLIQRYIGQEGASPRLDRIGGKSWENRKAKVRQSVEDLAHRLVELYARRKAAQGFSFPKDTDWQLEFEAAFPYEETDDQLRCIEEVKGDMESPRPMDRLICGDVGYGKTEVAMRAAFKSIFGGKQAAFLAPTTILVEQHYETAVERFARYPVKIEMLSRFVPQAEQRRIIKAVEAGEVDFLIGTHRLLQRDVHFKNLGLLVVDEEQRFGVKDKERLKELRASVDCLTLSATPIPRTLHMSLLKIRDMSLITTPPNNRRPIETFIREYDEDLVAEAIRREVERGGQVFYLHNRVETLDHVKIFLQKLIPEIIVDTAHGQMSSSELEDIMHRFIHLGSQVLVATTIIENGIDIPNVNTIIIDRADMYGISQLYQLRGRVGRSNRVAYAYLLYPGERPLTELAMKRLQIISDYTELGSGFKIALKDLEVRGAGNLLGREQHGDILSVGFDMYLRILDEAVAELSEEKEERAPDVYLELDYSGYIPDSYVSEPVEKMEVYKKIASVTTQEELDQVHLELQDRFGPLPEAVQSLLSLAEIRIICRSLSVSALRERGGTVEVEFAKVSLISADKVVRLIQESAGNVKLSPSRPNVLMLKSERVGLAEKSEFLRERLSMLA